MKTILFCLMTGFFLSCNSKQREEAPTVEVDLMRLPDKSGDPNANEIIVSTVQFSPPDSKNVQPRKWVKEGNIRFRTDDPEATKKQILAAVADSKGYVASDQQDRHGSETSYRLDVKVPSTKFDPFLSAATADVRVFDEKRISMTDVTTEYVDHEARLKSQKKIEDRYLQLITKAIAVKDILAIEKELGTIRTEIESKTAQLASLKNQIEYSDLAITFYKNETATPTWMQQYANAFSEGWNNALDISFAAIALWPYALLLLSAILVIRAFLKRKRRKMQDPDELP